MIKVLKYFLLIYFVPILLLGQNNYDKEYIELLPGEQYKSGWFHELVFGKHWREAWTTPIKVEILNLEKFAGGLKPLKKGGGFQTKSLRFLGQDGHIWKFRSMAKDPAKILPEILRKTFVADVFQDQISSAHPLAALVAAPIISSVGILQAKPYLVYMPDNPKLKEFRSEFANQVGMIEIHPDVDKELNVEFEAAEKVKSTFKLFDRLSEKRKERVDKYEYLKARLIDLLLGDWDRHTDQWKWAQYNINSKKLWRPIPRDRDQVFAKWDGLGPRIAEYLVPQFNNFDYDYPPIEDLSWSGRFIDRRFLTELTAAEWDSVTTYVVNHVTDEVIADAVNQLPERQIRIAGDEIRSKLISRRNKLKNYSKEYYELINDVVDIYTSEKNDIVNVTRQSDNTIIEVKYVSDKGESKLFYLKKFDNNITSELRIYTLGGDDKITISGDVESGPLVRVISGKGKDELIDSSKVDGYLFSILPIPNAEKINKFYDSGKKSKLTLGPSSTYCNEKVKRPKNYFEKYEPKQRDRGSNWLPIPIIGFNSNDGFYLGGGAEVYKYNFRNDPYEYWMSSSIAYYSLPSSITAEFHGVFNSILKNNTITVNTVRSNLVFTNYYGFGNETNYDKKLDKKNFYRVSNELFYINSSIDFNYFGTFKANVGFEFRINEFKIENKNLAPLLKDVYGLNRFNDIELFTNIFYDSRDNVYYPMNGINSSLNISFHPKIMDNEESFIKTEGFISAYKSFENYLDLTIAVKLGGGIIFGNKYPFNQALFIGGADNLRGFTRRRFAGDAAFYSSFETRLKILPLNIIVPGNLGITSFIETGRVFDDVFKNSSLWHPSFGGGIWMSWADRAIAVSLNIASSSETTAGYFNLGMGF